MNDKTLTICEIFKSIQGESSYAGQVCSFVRLSGCNLRCLWCDTVYALTEGTSRPLSAILEEVTGHSTTLVEITGGEPLLQEATPELCSTFLERQYTVIAETNGSLDISLFPKGVIRIVDVKCPGSGMGGSFLMENITLLTPADECKFVVASRDDFDWAIAFVKNADLHKRCIVHISPVLDRLAPSILASWIIECGVPVRLGLQLHKIIWGAKRGV
jgi:7-carboxy-7-deazaguanine synthase